MNKVRTIFLFVLITGLIFTITACSPSATPTPEKVIETVEVQVVETVIETVEVPVEVQVEVTPTPQVFSCEGRKMAYASFGSQFAFIAIVDQSMKDAAQEAGVELVFLDNEFSPDKAIENAEIIASRGDIDLVFEFNYYEQQNYVIAEIFEDAGIPAIAIDIPIPGSLYYGGNNYVAGKIAGAGLGEAAAVKWGDEPVDLVLVEAQDLAGQQTLEQRTLGIIAGVREALPYLTDEQVVRFEGGANVDEAAEAVRTTLEANPNAERVLIGMLGDSNAIAALNYAQESGRDVLAAGIGGDDVGINALRTGTPPGFVGTSLFLPENYGKDLIPLGCDIIAGKQVPAEVFVNHVFLTVDNLSEYYPE